MSKDNGMAEVINKLIGKKILNLRRSRKMSCKKLANIMHISQQQLYKYEKAINRISASRLIIISKIFDMPLSYFSEGVERIFEEVADTEEGA